MSEQVEFTYNAVVRWSVFGTKSKQRIWPKKANAHDFVLKLEVMASLPVTPEPTTKAQKESILKEVRPIVEALIRRELAEQPDMRAAIGRTQYEAHISDVIILAEKEITMDLNGIKTKVERTGNGKWKYSPTSLAYVTCDTLLSIWEDVSINACRLWPYVPRNPAVIREHNQIIAVHKLDQMAIKEPD